MKFKHIPFTFLLFFCLLMISCDSGTSPTPPTTTTSTTTTTTTTTTSTTYPIPRIEVHLNSESDGEEDIIYFKEDGFVICRYRNKSYDYLPIFNYDNACSSINLRPVWLSKFVVYGIDKSKCNGVQAPHFYITYRTGKEYEAWAESSASIGIDGVLYENGQRLTVLWEEIDFVEFIRG